MRIVNFIIIALIIPLTSLADQFEKCKWLKNKTNDEITEMRSCINIVLKEQNPQDTCLKYNLKDKNTKELKEMRHCINEQVRKNLAESSLDGVPEPPDGFGEPPEGREWDLDYVPQAKKDAGYPGPEEEDAAQAGEAEAYSTPEEGGDK